ncbi:MAG TPA: hypothetical protein VN461_17990 [Vicinamibacteria bacterium]|jgi:hypothetical protein|nr:hypothetical protein [Vicinamibacteria bacterium]
MPRGRWQPVSALVGYGSRTPTAFSAGSSGLTTAGSASLMLQASSFSEAKAVRVIFSEASVYLSGPGRIAIGLPSPDGRARSH